MNRNFKYELNKAMLFIIKLIISCLVLTLVSFVLNIKSNPYTFIGYSQSIDGSDFSKVSIVKANLLVIGISLVVNTFIFVNRSLDVNTNFTVTRKEIFFTIIKINLIISLIISIFLIIMLKLEPFYINKVLVNKSIYIYDNSFGNFDILKDNIFILILTSFMEFSYVIAMFTTIALIRYRFKSLMYIGFMIIFFLKDLKVFGPIKRFLNMFSIDYLTNGLNDIRIIALGVIFILTMYLITYISIKDIQIGGN